MQPTLGERLQQARQQQGLSLVDVARALNISKNFLLQFESNDFSIPLSKIYVRGFLTMYVRFLKLNEAEFLSEYEALSKSMDSHMLTPIGHVQIEMDKAPCLNSFQNAVSEPVQSSVVQFSKPVLRFTYLKAFVIAGGALLCFFVLHGCWPDRKSQLGTIDSIPSEPVSIKSIDEGALPIVSDIMSSNEVPKITVNNQSIPVYEKITLVASGPVRVLVRKLNDKQRLFLGSLKEGEQRSFMKEEALQISFSQGNNLYIERADGTLIHPPTSGRGWMQIQ